MNDDDLTDLVEAFLQRRERDPHVSPEEFAREQPQAPARLLRAMREALDVMSALADDEPAPQCIDGYRVVRELGRGGMGIVHEVERDGRHFALKRLSAAALLQANARARLRREAEALQRIDHPGVVRVREVGEADGIPHLVMDLVSGRPLDGRGPMPWRTVAELGQRIAAALAAVHGAGLCHRDLKPQNVLLTPGGQPVLIDFGLVHDAEAATLTGTGDLLGTPRYLAPEQVSGAGVDARTDLFALGLVLAELLSGRPVRRGDDRTSLLAEAQRGARPRLPADCPDGLVRIVHRALARRPADRFQGAGDLAAELGRVVAGEPVHTRAPGPVARGRDWFVTHPRQAGAALVLIVGLLAYGTMAIAGELHARRVEAADRQFAGGLSAWLAGDVDSSRRAADTALASDPAHQGALGLMALAATDPSTEQPAALSEPMRRALVHRGQQRWSEAAADLVAARDLDPDAPLPHVLLAEVRTQLGDHDGAVAALAAAARQLPDSVPLITRLAAARHAGGDDAGAAADYRRALDIEPGAWRIRRELAQVLYAVDAEAGLREAGRVRVQLGDARPDDYPDLLNLQASLLEKLGRSTEAIPLFRELVALDPESSRFCFNLAYALDRALQVPEARTWYEKALQLDAGNQHAALCLVWLLATAAPPLGDAVRAEQLLAATLTRDRGRSAAVLQMVREFVLRTRRLETLDATLGRLAADESLPADVRARLQHTQGYLRNATTDGR